jgi:replication-associated recombination protein RarA
VCRHRPIALILIRPRTLLAMRPLSGRWDPPGLSDLVTSMMKGFGYGQGYRYVHDEPAAKEEMPCLPERFQGRDYPGGGSSPPETADRSRLESARDPSQTR